MAQWNLESECGPPAHAVVLPTRLPHSNHAARAQLSRTITVVPLECALPRYRQIPPISPPKGQILTVDRRTRWYTVPRMPVSFINKMDR